MSYAPTLEKLHQIGHFTLCSPRYVVTNEYVWHRDINGAPDWVWRIFITTDNALIICEQGGWGAEGDTDSDGTVFCGTCPDENFFDLLVTAVGLMAPRPATPTSVAHEL